MLLNIIKSAGWQLSGVVIGWMKIFPGGNFLGANYPGDIIPGGSYPGWEFSCYRFQLQCPYLEDSFDSSILVNRSQFCN